MRLSMGLIKADIMAAEQAIRSFEELCFRDIKNIAAYHLQQAAEKLIKVQIYSRCQTVNNSSMYTHNLKKLIDYGDSLGIALDVPQYIRSKCLIITDWEAGSRYDVGFSIRINVLKKALHEISAWYDTVYVTGIR